MKFSYRQTRECRTLLAFVFLVLVLPGAALAAEYEIQAINHRNHESMFFEPDFIRIEPGDRITFAVTDFDHQPQSVLVPTGATHWQAEKGQPITVVFSQEGVYIHDCAYHNVMGMAGVILVGNPVNLREARQFYEKYKKETFAMNKDRLDVIWDPTSGLLTDAAAPD
jgi:pseudoazurin